jgi:Rrf2 family iron-sulfur cluster assembly transcriptional regulator
MTRVPHSGLRIVEVEMDLSISTASRYGLRAVFDIAYHGGGQLSQIKDISNRQKISQRYLEQIFNKLLKAGLLKSRRGPRGGYLLSRDPSEITVLDIMNATQGAIEPVLCLNEEKRTCEVFPACVTWHVWKETQNMLVDYFDSVTIADLLALACKQHLP